MMNGHKIQKLNQLLKAWPHGTVAVSSWLRDQGVYRQLAEVYQKSAWIESIGHGAFIHAGDKVDWTGGLYALQEELHLAIHTGGRTALQLQGYAHFLSLGANQSVFLFGAKRFLPGWFSQHKWNQPIHYVYTNCFPYQKNLGLSKRDTGPYSITLSAPELAMLEVLYLIGQHETYENAVLLMEGLNTLRPALLQKLLEQTSSIKVKRLFMHMAERFNHPWLKNLNISKIDFGKGKRVIAEGGSFDSKYNISVPKVNL